MLKDEDISYIIYIYSSTMTNYDQDMEEIDMV